MIKENIYIVNNHFNNNLKKINNIIINLIIEYKYYLLCLFILLVLLYFYYPKIKTTNENLKKFIKYDKQLLSLSDIKNNKPTIDIFLDVRSSEEYNNNKLKKSINIDYKDILNNEDVLKKNNITKDKSILVYCKSGKRSSLVVDKMINEYNYNKNNIYLTTEDITNKL